MFSQLGLEIDDYLVGLASAGTGRRSLAFMGLIVSRRPTALVWCYHPHPEGIKAPWYLVSRCPRRLASCPVFAFKCGVEVLVHEGSRPAPLSQAIADLSLENSRRHPREIRLELLDQPCHALLEYEVTVLLAELNFVVLVRHPCWKLG